MTVSFIAKADTIQTITFTNNESVVYPYTSQKTILDTLRNSSILRGFFFKHETIKGQKFNSVQKEFKRNVPGVKQIKIRQKENYNWKFWILMLITLTVIVARFINVKIFDNVISVSYSFNTKRVYNKEKNGTTFIIFILLQLIFTSTIALFSIIYSEYRQIISTEIGLNTFYKVLVFVMIVYFFKIIFLKTISSIFKISDIANEIIINTFAINNLVGMFLLPVLMIYIYSPSNQIKEIAFQLNIIIIIAGIIYRMIKNILTGFNLSPYPIIYIFIYLCALEIFPVFIIFKLLINKIPA